MRKRKVVEKEKMESRRAVSVVVVVRAHVSSVSHVIISVKGVHSSYKML